mmetsp:Transcript_62824/g.182262  ORF Transcript_62824/g.182262 Transcript_62824/m.182262 type:complete len:326 (-) Transcript_62824:367-1344(-)
MGPFDWHAVVVQSDPNRVEVEATSRCLLHVGDEEVKAGRLAGEQRGRHWPVCRRMPLRSFAVGALLSAVALASVRWDLAKSSRAGRRDGAVEASDLQALDEQSATLPWYMDTEPSTSPSPRGSMNGPGGTPLPGFSPNGLRVGEQTRATGDERIQAQQPRETHALGDQPGAGARSYWPQVPPIPPRLRTRTMPSRPPATPAPSHRLPPPIDDVPEAGVACATADGVLLMRGGQQQFNANMKSCSLPCLGDPDCVSDCFSRRGYTSGCSTCFGMLSGCTRTRCIWYCIGGDSPGCRRCADDRCKPIFQQCSGLSLDWERYADQVEQ